MCIRSGSRRGVLRAIGRQAGAALCIGAAMIVVAHSVSGQGLQPATDPAKIVPQPPMDTSTKPWTGKRTPDGQPDIQGYWRTLNALGGGGRSVENLGETHMTAAGLAPLTYQPSRIVDPPDGRLPIQPWALARVHQQEWDLENATQPWHVDPQARCIQGPPRWQYYVSDFLITQAPGMVVFTYIHYQQYRVIRLDKKEHLVAPDVKLWYGDSIGYWEGNTLNVDLANVNGKVRVSMRGDFVTDQVQLKERFVVMGPGNIIWEQTVTDPKVYTRPFTMRVPLGPSQPGYMLLSPTGEAWEDDCWESLESRPSLMPGFFAPQTQKQP